MTVFFEDEPPAGSELAENAPPIWCTQVCHFFSLCSASFPFFSSSFADHTHVHSVSLGNSARQAQIHVEKMKQGAQQMQRVHSSSMEKMREEKRESEYQAYRSGQKSKMDALDAYLESARIEFESRGNAMDVDAQHAITSASSLASQHANTLSSSNAPQIGASAVVESIIGISDFEKAKMTHRMKTSQLKMELIARRDRDDKIQTMFEALPHLTEEEVTMGLLMFGDDEFDAIEEYERFPELRGLRFSIAKKHMEEAKLALKPKGKRTAVAKAKSSDAPKSTAGRSKRTSAKSSSSQQAATVPGNMYSHQAPPTAASSNTISLLTPNENAVNNLFASSSINDSIAAQNYDSSMQVTSSNISTSQQNRDPQLEAIAALLPVGTELSDRRHSIGLAAGPLNTSSSRASSNNGSKYDSDGEEISDGGNGEGTNGDEGDEYPARSSHKKKKQITVKKLKLDDAIAQGSMEGWSTARMRAWNLRHENPNAYYYRFNHPGEVQRNGKWTDEEREAFVSRMHEVGVNGQWGIFAKEIYGRVGYQCANFYRQLIENGDIEDPRYSIDESGKAHYLFSKRKTKVATPNGSDPMSVVTSPSGITDEDMEEGELGLDGLTKVTREGRDIYIPKINFITRRPSTSTSSQSQQPRARSAPKQTMASDSSSIAGGAPDSSLLNGGLTVILAPTVSSPAPTPVKRTSAASSSSSNQNTGAAGSAEPKPKKKPASKKRKRDADGGDEDYKPSSTWARERADREAVAAQKNRIDSNPLPGFLDVITNTELSEPAISPYGHVLSYSTWMKCLSVEPKNTCPFTKKPIKKRDLVILTWENVEAYKDKIDRSGQ